MAMADMTQFDPGMAPPPGGAPPPGPGMGGPPPGGPPQGGAGGPADIVEMVLQEEPELVEQMLDSILGAVESGELTPEEMAQLANLAQTALMDPRGYNALVKFSRENGLTDPLPPGGEEALITTAALVAALEDAQQVVQEAGMGGSPSPTGRGGEGGGNGEMAQIDGYQQDGRYLIPSDAVLRIGTDKLDKMIEPPDAKIKTGPA